MSRNDWDVFYKKRSALNSHIKSLLPKSDELCYTAKITNGISEIKLDETILSSKLEVDCYDSQTRSIKERWCCLLHLKVASTIKP